MKPAMLACLAILLLVPGAALSRAVDTPRQPGTSQKAAPAADGAPAPRAGERRRRTSYARCNRTAHERGLRGGVRRRFMIRCRLGYEKPRQPSQTQQAAPQPTQNQPAQAAPNPASNPAPSSQPPAATPAKRP